MPHDLSQERVSRLTGIALMCGAVACFALLDTTAKYLNLYMSTLQVVWARYTGAFLFPFIVSNPWTRPGLTRTKRPLLQLARSVLLLASTLCNFAGLRYLQLDEAIALIFSTPFFVAALSGPMLGEWVRWRRWSAIAVGFIGVLVVSRPGAASFQPAALLSLSAALCYALYSIATRILAHRFQRDHAVLFEHRGRARPASGRAAGLDDAQRPPRDRPHGGDRRGRQLRSLPPDRGAPLGAGGRVVAVHLYRDRAGDCLGLSGFRRCAQSLHAHRRGDRGRLRSVHALSRAQDTGKRGIRGQRSGTLIGDSDRCNLSCLSSGGKANFRCPAAHRRSLSR